MGLIFFGVLALGGLSFIVTGFQVLLSDCVSVAIGHSGGARFGVFNLTCMSSGGGYPSWLAGWGAIVVGLLAISAILWLPRVMWRFSGDRRRQIRQQEEQVKAKDAANLVIHEDGRISGRFELVNVDYETCRKIWMDLPAGDKTGIAADVRPGGWADHLPVKVSGSLLGFVPPLWYGLIHQTYERPPLRGKASVAYNNNERAPKFEAILELDRA